MKSGTAGLKVRLAKTYLSLPVWINDVKLMCLPFVKKAENISRLTVCIMNYVRLSCLGNTPVGYEGELQLSQFDLQETYYRSGSFW